MDIKVAVRLPYTTGLPRDVAMNTFTVFTDSIGEPDTTQQTALSTAIARFYNTALTTPAKSISDWLSPVLSRVTGAARIQYFNLSAGGPAFFEHPFTLGPSDSDVSMPLEVALCTTIVGAAGDPPVLLRNRRGRMYIGPLNVNVMTSGTGYPVPNADFLDTVRLSTERLADELETAAGGTGFGLQVWSPTVLVGSPVVYGWVDNEFDTQRRREVDATDREFWGTPEV